MHKEQLNIIDYLNVLPVINVDKEIAHRKAFLTSFLEAGFNGFVLGISGGQDSALAGKLAQEAVTEFRNKTGKDVKFHAVMLPYGIQKDFAEAETVARDFINADIVINFNIKDTVDAFEMSYNNAFFDGQTPNGMLEDFHKGNVKARVRMTTQYAIAGQHNLLVIGTDHAAENVTGFYTKYGDGAADVLPLAGLNKRQGKKILQSWDSMPEFFLTKKPTADLLDAAPQQADETELGLSYEAIDDYLEGKTIADDEAEKLEQRFLQTMHKRVMPLEP